jgi:cytidylate kinase
MELTATLLPDNQSDVLAMKRIKIAVDGPSSSGKSTLARDVAHALNYVYIDTGAMYRAVTLFALRERLVDSGVLNVSALETSLERIFLSFRFNAGTRRSEICLNGRTVEKEIRSMEVSKYVSPVAEVADVRTMLVRMQQKMGSSGGVVMDGRDIGSVVLPDAELKFYLTANLETRTARRVAELSAKGKPVDADVVRENLIMRDRIDSTRIVAPLVCAKDAIVVDNSDLSIEQQFEFIMGHARQVIQS